MSNQITKFLVGAMAATTLIGCDLGVDRNGDPTPEGFYYEGYIYNGVTNERVTEVDVTISQRGEDISAEVNDEGHFMVGPVKPDHDYVVTIGAEGYRDFFAANVRLPNLPNSEDDSSTLFYEAFLFPTNISSPEVTLDFYTPDGIDARPNGTLRLTPAVGSALSAIHLDATTTTPSVGGQIWTNDADSRQRTVNLPVDDGQVVVDEGALVYGVAYRGTIFGSDGYAYQDFFYTSGLEGNRTVSLNRLDPQALALTANSLQISNRDANAEIVLTFNQSIELAEGLPQAQLAEILDDGFSINSPNFDNDGDRNVLVSNVGDDTSMQGRGVSMSISGNTLTLSWAREDSNFDTMDDGDPIESATYTGLGNVNLRIADGRVDQEVNLATLLGTGTLTIFVGGESATNPPPPLALSSTATMGAQDPATGSVTVVYTFNRDIEFDPDTFTQAEIAEFIDDAFNINSPNAQVNPDVGWDMFNTQPIDISAFTQELGTTISISGDELTLTWDKTLATVDPLDPVLDVTFGNLGLVQIRPVGTTGAEDTTLDAFAGASTGFALTP